MHFFQVQKTLSLEKGFTLPAAGPPEYDDVTEEPTTAAKTLVVCRGRLRCNQQFQLVVELTLDSAQEKDPSALKAEIISATKRVLLQVRGVERTYLRGFLRLTFFYFSPRCKH